ncbi:kinesin-like protein KIF24 [Pelodytes ibericus]
MSSCLFECLCEAELEKYYPQFIAAGLEKIEELATVTMRDYARLGVHNMEDRKRLFQLIKIIQSVSQEDSAERTPLQPGCVYLQPTSTRRQLQFDSLDLGRNASSPSEPSGLSHTYTVKRPGELFDISLSAEPTHSGKIPTPDAHTDLSYPAEECSPKTCPGKNTAAAVSDCEVPVIHRVTHVSGYNYGVPQSCLRSSGSEKEGPWTETDKIRVCVRKRPLGLREERRGEVNVVTVENKETIFIYERKEAVNLKEYILQHVFYFDEVFSETFSNQDVYMKTAHPLIQHVFNGGNATCFAYGQTGAGKTYTMIGTQKNPGLYALAAKDIFQQLETLHPRKDCAVWISFYEIYCGQLYDLLNGRKRLFAREDGKHVVQIVGLREVQVRSVDLLLDMILKGSRERSTGATGVNSDSSRSHAVIQIQIKDAGNRKLGRISFIDLAGSERASDARESDKQTKMEGAEINQSLLALKECIRALDQEQAHTPFRQSKLTQVLKDSFIGNSKTCMIANVSPSHMATEHTLNTLRYADRVKELKKGMKYAAPCTNRSRTTTCLSPKRMQNSSTVLGEKISPKKVKLGQQPTSTSNTARNKPSPSVFHPNNVPLSSTPKTYSKTNPLKGNASQVWLNHTTPVKGAVKVANSGRKRADIHTKYPLDIKSEMSSGLKGLIQKDHFSFNQQPVAYQRIQAVQPVQKQIVPRTSMSFGDPNYKLGSDGNNDQSTSDKCTDTDSGYWASKLPLQKEREQHLRSYHQQFQHPPILQQKLQYQPLEKILDRYKPQGVKVENSGSPRPHSHCEGGLLEEFDDSDFSEDSFSYSSIPKKSGREEMVSQRLSFFLHRASPEAGIGKPSRWEDGLQFNYGESQDFSQADGWRCGNASVSPEKKVQRDTEKPTFWSSEEDCESSKISNTPEKPYSSQEDLANQLKNTTYPLSVKSRERDISSQPSGISSSHEPSDRSVSLMDAGGLEMRQKAEIDSDRKDEYCDHHDTSSGSEHLAPLSLSLLQDNWQVQPVQDLKSEEPSPSSANSAKNLSCDKAWTAGSEQGPFSPNDRCGGKKIIGLVKQMLQQNEPVNLHNSASQERFSEAESGSDCCGSFGSPQFCVGQGLCDRTSAQGASLRLAFRSDDSTGRDSSSDFAIGRYNEHPASRCYDADTEETTIKIPKDTPKPGETEWKKPSASPAESGERQIKGPSGSSPDRSFQTTTNIQPKPRSPGSGQLSKTDIGQAESKSSNDSFKLTFKDSELEHLRSTLIKCIFSHGGASDGQSTPSCAHNTSLSSPWKPTAGSSQTHSADVSNLQARPLEKAEQLVVQAHREQLDEMAALGAREEQLLSQIPHLDFKDYVAKLDEILVLKSKYIHSMRSQLQLFMAYPQSGETAERSGGI